MYYLYIIISEKYRKTYVGQCADIKIRLEEHNTGKVKSSKPYSPYRLLYLETHSSREEALKREKFFKTYSGRKQITKIMKAEMAELVDALDSKSSEAQTS